MQRIRRRRKTVASGFFGRVQEVGFADDEVGAGDKQGADYGGDIVEGGY